MQWAKQALANPGFRRKLRGVALALGLGAAGGTLFWWLTLPLPWMLGPIFFNLVASMLRVPIVSPAAARPWISIVIGLMLGASFSPAMVGQAAGWLASLSLLAVYLAVSALVVVPYYRRIVGLDPVTAYFAGMPGGLTEMTFVGRDFGGDDRTIVLAHASRMMIVVTCVAIYARFNPSYDPSLRLNAGVTLAMVPWKDLAILLAGGVFGLLVGRRLRLPAPQLLGPMLVSAVLHLTEVVTLPPPRELVILAQIGLGTIVGCRFVGTSPRIIFRSLLYGCGATMLMLSITVAFATILSGLVGQSTIQILLAYSPGGLAEMSLVAIAMHADVAFIAVHHIVRITLILIAAPLVFRLINRRQSK